MTKIARYVFETAFGPFVAWCCAELLLFAACAYASETNETAALEFAVEYKPDRKSVV